MNRLIAFAVAWSLIFSAPLSADIVTMGSGRKIECLVLQKSDTSVLVRLGYGTMAIPADEISSIETKPLPGISTKEARRKAATRAATNPAVLVIRLPPWADCIDALAICPWATGLIQIPATVVNNGELRFVPYLSQRCGTDYEMNVYGDPDFPACIEIGVRGDLLKSDEAKHNCINYIASVLRNPADIETVSSIGLLKRIVMVDGLTFEITPPTDPDAYGGWWISVYDTDLLNKSRATGEELKYITMSKASAAAVVEQERKRKEHITYSDQDQSVPATSDASGWTTTDMQQSRGGSGGGDVYVRGYTRANGTYVSPYTRASPGMGRGGGGRR